MATLSSIVQGALGYIALNKAGDTMTGALTVNSTITSTNYIDALTPNNGSTGGMRIRGNATSGYAYLQVIDSTGAAQWGAAGITSGGVWDWTGGSKCSSLGIGTAPSGTTGEIRATNAITAYYSDRRLKTEISKVESALDKIDQLCGVIYTQNKLAEEFGYNNYEQQVGLYAQDVAKVLPQAVKPAPFDIAEDGSSKSGQAYLTVQYEKLVPLLVEGIKELRAEVKKLKGE